VGSTSERNPSLWVSTSDATAFAPLESDRAADVVVVGAGITGLTAARLLAAAGASVVVIDAGPLCAGATGYTTAKVTALHGLVYRELIARHGIERATAYAAANHAAIADVAAFVADDGIECDFTRASAYTYTEQAAHRGDIEAEVEAARRCGLDADATSETELPFPVDRAVVLHDQAHFHPRRYCIGLAHAVTQAGSAVHERTRALHVENAADGCTVRTDRGTLRADHVVLATHLPFPHDGAFFARAHPYRSYAIAVQPGAGALRGMYLSAETPTRSVRPTANGWLIVGGEGHKTGHDPHTMQRYEALESWARQRFAVETVGFRWSAQDYKTVDGFPYVGRIEARKSRVLVATGFRKWGMTNGTAAARIIADTIAGRDNPWAKAFDATRVAPNASAKRLAQENIAVGWRFVADRLKALRPRRADDLQVGEGAVVHLDGDKVAAMRDDDGTLRAVSAKCTHLGCVVAFNEAERTWDCPCHGSRFDADGHVIEGPAVDDLAPRAARPPA
jgi:glycine/D-amino acid oxidase-like deaminating enzyme/nitrite reductase/ring-hydroxylating ferredoxin subunit